MFYHASNIEFHLGQVYTISDFEGEYTKDHNNRSEAEKHINNMLDFARPNETLSRKKCIYLFDNLIACMAYARNLTINHIYEVDTIGDTFGPYPMTLLTTLNNCSDAYRQTIIGEYWNPTQRWKVYEYLASSITILREIPLGNGGHNNDDYIDDRTLSRKLYGC